MISSNQHTNISFKDNLRKFILFLIPISAVLGNYATIANFGFLGINVWRLIIIIGFVLFAGLGWLKNISGRRFFFLLYLWLSWGALSLIWSPNVTKGMSDLANIFLALLMVVALFNMRAYEANNLKALCFGWVGAYVLAGGVAVWELVTSNHLHNIFMEQAGLDVVPGFMTISFFSNPNNYGAFILLSAPFIWFAWRSAKGKIAQIFFMALMISIPFFLTTSGSRIAIAGFIAQTFVMLMIQKRNRTKGVMLLVIAMLVLAASVYIVTEQKGINAIKYSQFTDKVFEDPSFETRLNMSIAGLLMLWDSRGIGYGAGSFESVTQLGRYAYLSSGLYVSHNFLIEILSEYGIIIFGFFIYLFIGLFHEAYMAQRRIADDTTLPENIFPKVLIAGLTGYLFASICHSSYMQEINNWTFLATMNVIGAYLYDLRCKGLAG